jgi:hypothetical protein
MMNFTIEFFPLFSLEWLAAAGAIGFLSLCVSAIRQRRGFFLRLAAMSCLLLALANPHLKREERQPLSNIAVVVTDESSSQQIAGRAERAREIEAHLRAGFAKLPNLEVRWVKSRNAKTPGGETTQLFGALSEALTDVPKDRVAGAIMITDGQIHDAPQNLQALGLEAPLHAILTGTRDEKDNRIEIVTAPRFGLTGSRQLVELKAVRSGSGPSTGIARFRIRKEDGSVETAQAAYDTPVRFYMEFGHAGQNILEAGLEPEPDELTTINNRAVVQAEGVRENLRVLLVSGEPHAGERTWRNLLRSDAAVDLVHFTILRPPEKHDGTPVDQLSLISFPTRELFSEKLEQFDLIIFDRYQRRGVLPMIYLDNVARYVENGGAVLVSAGAEFATGASLARTPLGDVLPATPSGRVVSQPFRPLLTEAGAKHPVTAGLPGSAGAGKQPSWGSWFRLIDSSATGGEILMSGAENKPLLVLDRRMKGRVALLLSDHAWLWSRGYEGGGPYADLLRRMAHWLMKEPDLEEESLTARAGPDELKVERRSIRDAVGKTVLTSPSGVETELSLDRGANGVWTKTVTAPEPGVHRVTQDGMTAFAVAGEMNSLEFKRLVTTTEALQPLLTASGGGAFYAGGTPGAEKAPLPAVTMVHSVNRYAGASWLGLRARNAYEVKGAYYTPLVTGFAALGIALSLLALTWYREGV